VIITRTPLRISLGGGGTDLPSYSDVYGGMVISAAINRYMFISLNKSFSDDYQLKYSQLERAKTIDEIEHPIIREALTRHYLPPGTEIVSVADIPSGTGLGTSGSFTVGLLRALTTWRRDFATPDSLAEEACSIEIESLGRPVGKQDQYIAAFGGLAVMDFHTDGSVSVLPLRISSETLAHLESNLVMYFTGYSRDADLILARERETHRQTCHRPSVSLRIRNTEQDESHCEQVLGMEESLETHEHGWRARHGYQCRGFPTIASATTRAHDGHDASRQDQPSEVAETQRRGERLRLVTPVSHRCQPVQATMTERRASREGNAMANTKENGETRRAQRVQRCGQGEIDRTTRRISARHVAVRKGPR